MATTTKQTVPPPLTRAVNLRVPEDVRDLIDQAARVNGKTRSDFDEGNCGHLVRRA